MSLHNISTAQMESSAEAVGVAICGRKVRVVYGEEADGAKWNHDTNSITVPRLGTMSDKDILIWFSNICHEFGHAWFTQYKELENHTLFRIWNFVEDVVMERKTGEKFVGARISFHDSAKHFNIKAAETLSKIKPGRPRPVIWESLVYMMFLDSGLQPVWTLSPKAQQIYDIAWPIFCRHVHSNSSMENLAIAEDIYKAIYGIIKNENEKPNKPDQKGEKPSDEKGEKGDNKPDKSGDKPSDKNSDNKPSGEKNNKPSPNGKPSDEKPEGNSTSDSDEKGDKQVIAEMEELLEGETKGDFNRGRIVKIINNAPANSYGEKYTSYRANDKIVVPANDEAGYKESVKHISGQVSALRRQLENDLRSLCNSNSQYNLTRGRVDRRALVGFSIGTTNRIFMRESQSISLSTAVSIVIDQSSSMASYRGTDTPKFKHCEYMALLVGECLSGMNIPFEIIGSHTSQISNSRKMGFTRENPVNYLIYKAFNETWQTVRSRLASMYAAGCNVDGEALEFAANRLASRKENRKIIFSLSDGIPNGGITGDWNDMGDNLINVCKRIRDAGTECYGFGICTEGPKYFYGEENFIHVENSKDVGSEFFRKLSKTLVKK